MPSYNIIILIIHSVYYLLTILQEAAESKICQYIHTQKVSIISTNTHISFELQIKLLHKKGQYSSVNEILESSFGINTFYGRCGL